MTTNYHTIRNEGTWNFKIIKKFSLTPNNQFIICIIELHISSSIYEYRKVVYKIIEISNLDKLELVAFC